MSKHSHEARARVSGPRSVQDWLDWQRAHAPAPMALGLARCAAVADRLGGVRLPFVTVAVGGTNGKGSSVRLLDAMLSAAGPRVGAFYSPPLDRFEETVTANGSPVSPGELVAAFEAVADAAGDVALTPFEFQTLAAVTCFRHADVDFGLLEVGLGGRLDAVNAFDLDAALVTNVGLDHQHWLGPDRETIGREKAGIARRGRPLVMGESAPPDSLVAVAAECGAHLLVRGQDFDAERDAANCLHWRGYGRRFDGLLLDAAFAPAQLDNAAAAIALCVELAGLRLTPGHVEHGLRHGRLPGRQQWLPATAGCPVTRLLDVSHNAESVAALAETLAASAAGGRTLAVLSMLADKDAAAAARAVADHVDDWYLAGTPAPRGQSAGELAAKLAPVLGDDAVARRYGCVGEAYNRALDEASEGDRVVVFGSFHTVREVRRLESMDA